MRSQARAKNGDILTINLTLTLHVPVEVPRAIYETLGEKEWEAIAQLQSYIEDICQPGQIDMILEARQRGFYSLIQEIFDEERHKKIRPVVEKMLNALKGSPLFGKLDTMPKLRKMV